MYTAVDELGNKTQVSLQCDTDRVLKLTCMDCIVPCISFKGRKTILRLITKACTIFC